ncbi:MAG: S16 family serine protease, partial [Myxococcota bacterium]
TALTRRTIKRFLGPPPYLWDRPGTRGEVGVANGLAWTESGGEVLTVEATMTRGSGLMLTGQLGNVMKESAQTALTYVRGTGTELDFDEALFQRHEVHVHVPAGATPKDGPSAGIAMATALTSLATRIPVRADVAMTGEITLRGRVLPVGGVREKALAALRAGISRVILPRQNLQDLAEIPKDLKRRITFIPVDHQEQVLEAALESIPVRGSTRRTLARDETRAPLASAKSR